MTPNLTSLSLPSASRLTGAAIIKLPALVPNLRCAYNLGPILRSRLSLIYVHWWRCPASTRLIDWITNKSRTGRTCGGGTLLSCLYLTQVGRKANSLRCTLCETAPFWHQNRALTFINASLHEYTCPSSFSGSASLVLAAGLAGQGCSLRSHDGSTTPSAALPLQLELLGSDARSCLFLPPARMP